VSFYKRFEAYILITLKFLVGLFVFSQIGRIGLYLPIFEPLNTSPMQLPYTLLMAMLFTVMTMTVGYGLIIINICIQTSSALGVMAFIAAFMTLILFFYARLAPRENFLILATFFAFQLGIPYIVPLLAGLYLGLTSIIPVSIGIMIVSLVPFFRFLLDDALLMAELLDVDLTLMPEYFGGLYTAIFSDIMGNQAWIFTAFTFAMVIFIVYIVSRFTIDHSREIALGAGLVVMIISSIIAQIIAPPGTGLGGVVFAVILSGLLAFLALFFDMVLDYQRTERVQFEDETNFYQVKIIPKIATSRKQRVLKRISVREEDIGSKDYLLNDYPDELPRSRPSERPESRYDRRPVSRFDDEHDDMPDDGPVRKYGSRYSRVYRDKDNEDEA